MYRWMKDSRRPMKTFIRSADTRRSFRGVISYTWNVSLPLSMWHPMIEKRSSCHIIFVWFIGWAVHFRRVGLMAELIAYNEKVETIFDLIGDRENDITKSKDGFFRESHN